MKPIRLTRGPVSGATYALRQYRERADGVIVTGNGPDARTDVSGQYDSFLLTDVLGDSGSGDDVSIMQALDAVAMGLDLSGDDRAALALLWDRLDAIARRHNARVEADDA